MNNSGTKNATRTKARCRKVARPWRSVFAVLGVSLGIFGGLSAGVEPWEITGRAAAAGLGGGFLGMCLHWLIEGAR